MTTRKKAVVGLLIAFFAVFAVLTIWMRSGYQNQLVKVDLVVPSSGSIFVDVSKYGEASLNRTGTSHPYKVKVEVPSDEFIGKFTWQKDSSIIYKAPGISDEERDSVVIDLKVDELGYKVIVGLNDSRVKVGDSIEVIFRGRVLNFQSNLVPCSVLHEDQLGKYIYVVVRQQGAWGKEYLVKKERVNVLHADSENAHLSGYTSLYPIIIDSDSDIKEGMKVRFYP